MRLGDALKLKLNPWDVKSVRGRLRPIEMGAALQAWAAASRGLGLIIVRLLQLLLSHGQRELGLTKCEGRCMCET